MMRKHLVRQLACAVVLCGATAGACAQIAVIVNPRSGVDSMTPDQVSALFLGRTDTLPSGAAAKLTDQSDTSAIYETFYSKVTGRTAQQVKSTWSRLTFSGKATPPAVMASSADVRRFVASQPNAIGYVERSAADGAVKVVLVVD